MSKFIYPIYPSFDDCQYPDPSLASDTPIRIKVVNKSANPETVELGNVSAAVVDLTGWRMCSITGNQEHGGIGGTIASGETRVFEYTGDGFIWNNSTDDDGQLVSYWDDPTDYQLGLDVWSRLPDSQKGYASVFAGRVYHDQQRR